MGWPAPRAPGSTSAGAAREGSWPPSPAGPAALRRQQILYQDDPVRLWAVIDEAALRRRVGGTAVMRGQIRHLIEIAQLAHVNIQIQVLPLSAGGHAAGVGCITMLRFSEAELPDVVYLEQLLTAVYLGKPADSAHYRDVLNRLAAEAEPPEAAAATLDRILTTGLRRSAAAGLGSSIDAEIDGIRFNPPKTEVTMIEMIRLCPGRKS